MRRALLSHQYLSWALLSWDTTGRSKKPVSGTSEKKNGDQYSNLWFDTSLPAGRQNRDKQHESINVRKRRKKKTLYGLGRPRRKLRLDIFITFQWFLQIKWAFSLGDQHWIFLIFPIFPSKKEKLVSFYFLVKKLSWLFENIFLTEFVVIFPSKNWVKSDQTQSLEFRIEIFEVLPKSKEIAEVWIWILNFSLTLSQKTWLALEANFISILATGDTLRKSTLSLFWFSRQKLSRAQLILSAKLSLFCFSPSKKWVTRVNYFRPNFGYFWKYSEFCVTSKQKQK